MPKISVIIQVYNVASYIVEAIESLKRQTIGLENLDVIFVDDCSTDDSIKLIRTTYASTLSNAFIKGKMVQRGNQGMSVFLMQKRHILYFLIQMTF